LDTDFFLLSPDNGKFPRSLLPYKIPLMHLRNLHAGSYGYQLFFGEENAEIEWKCFITETVFSNAPTKSTEESRIMK